MSFFRPLRNDRTRFSSRAMMGGPRRPPGNAKPVMADIGPWGRPSQEYVPPPPQSYDRHPGFMESPEPEYEPYEWEIPHPMTPLRRDPGPSRPIQPFHPGIPDDEPASPGFSTPFASDEQFFQDNRLRICSK